MTIAVELDENERKARQMFRDYFDDEGRWSPNRATIALVFRAMWYSQLTAKRIDAVGTALCGYTVNLQEACDELTKAKILRKRRIHGEPHYEVNF